MEAKRAPHIKKLNLRYQTSADFVNTTDATGTNIPFYVNIEFGTGAGASAPYLFNNPSCTSLFFCIFALKGCLWCLLCSSEPDGLKKTNLIKLSEGQTSQLFLMCFTKSCSLQVTQVRYFIDKKVHTLSL